MRQIRSSILAAASALALVGAVQAGVTADQAARLGKDLTPVGAETAGNKDGTIPAWTGGITKPPAGYRAGMFHPDPFAADKPLFAITPQNAKDYAAKLTPGPGGDVREVQDVQDEHLSDAPLRLVLAGGLQRHQGERDLGQARRERRRRAGCIARLPVPDSAERLRAGLESQAEVQEHRRHAFANQVAPTATGAYTPIRIEEEFLGLYYRKGATTENINNILLYFFQEVVSPARLAGNVLLVHETLNASAAPRQAWIYNPGQRRVRRAPNVAYDNPGTATDGLRTNDMTDMFNGAMDRFEWKLVGKKEMFVPYNSYKAHSNTVKLKDLVRPGHLNPELLRYELHRVWVVDATLKKGMRHINSRRTFYLDEDSYQIVAIDHYDGRGRLWRYSEAPSINYYEVPTFWATVETHHDLQSGRYISGLLDNEEKSTVDFGFRTAPENFSPQSLRQRGIR
jgi:hypothetical protein